MEIRFTTEQEAQLSQIAASTGVQTEDLVRRAALRMVDETNRFRGAVQQGLAEARRGDLVEDEDVRAWLEQQERS